MLIDSTEVYNFIETYRCKGGAKECANRKLLFRMAEQKLNEILYSRGYATVSDLYDSLNKPREASGNIYGWDVGPIKFKTIYDGKFKIHYQIEAKFLNH